MSEFTVAFAGCAWMEAVSRKNLKIKTNSDTCGQAFYMLTELQ